MGDAVDNIRATIVKIEDAVDAAKAGWHGDAHAAFVTASVAWHDEAERLKGVLDRITEQVGHGTHQLKAMDADHGFAGLNI
jgi:WXG100 family type VII secretion target